MAEGRERSEWGRASCLLALIANVNRDPKKTKAFKPADFDPYAARSARREGATTDISLLKEAFTGRKGNISCAPSSS